MNLCQPHWEAMRRAVDDRGLSHLVAPSNAQLIAKLERELQQYDTTAETFDPLLLMHWSVCGNAIATLSKSGIDPNYLFSSGAAPEGRNDCPLCELNYLHKHGCSHDGCTLDREHGYDWMIDRAADDALAMARDLKLAPLPS